jgi:hypothetical protein
MKQKITLLVLAAVCVFGMNAQVIFTQNFNSYSSVVSSAATSWKVVNNSSPLGTTSWFMGNPSFFQAYTSPDSTYFAANYNNTTGSTGTISTWLISPTVTIADGGVLQFATRTATAQTPAPDRLEVYYSIGTGSNVGTTANAVGTFSTLVKDVNAGLTANGYPTAWTVYSVALSGVPGGTVTGRFGFRYFVTSAGPQGTNSNYIGIDEVKYTLPCAAPTIAINTSTTEICSGNVVTLTGSGANTYTWSNGQTSTTTVVSPVATTVYTLTGSSIPGCNSTETVAITVTVTPSLSVNNVTTCPGTAATLVASGASTYSWNTGATTNSIVVTPTTSTNYIVTGYNGVCETPQYVSVTLGTSLSVIASANQPTLCSARTLTLMGSGALTYTWKPSNPTLTGQSVTVAPTATGTTVYTLTAASGSCTGMTTLSIQVLPLPTQTITASAGPFTLAANGNLTLCPLTVINFTANSTSATSYSWVGASGPGSVYTATLPTTSGTVTIPTTFSAIATGTNGCSRTSTANITVRTCSEVGIESKELNAGIAVFPNPFGNELKITGLKGRVEVYSALGQLVLKQAVTDTSEILNTESLAKGVYILKLYNTEDKLMSTQKVIRN